MSALNASLTLLCLMKINVWTKLLTVWLTHQMEKTVPSVRLSMQSLMIINHASYKKMLID